MQQIRDSVASASVNAGGAPKTTKSLMEWHCDPLLECGLKQYFGSDNRFNTFALISKKILMLLHQLIRDKTNRIAPKDQVSLVQSN
jgi:hypothetical protein